MASRDWEGHLLHELNTMTEIEQIVACGEWITFMTQELLTQLADRRRAMVVAVLSREDWDAARLAETIGARRNTIQRLAEEGRFLAKSNTPPLSPAEVA